MALVKAWSARRAQAGTRHIRASIQNADRLGHEPDDGGLARMPAQSTVVLGARAEVGGADADEEEANATTGISPQQDGAARIVGQQVSQATLLVTDTGLVPTAQGGLGYMLFAIAMTVGRFGGDAVVARIGDRATLLWGGLAAVAGFVVLLVAPIAAIALGGFLLIGLGASNLVPVLFRRAGAQTAMPPALAVSAITTTGYAGILAGPAVIGFVAQAISLHGAFWVLALLMCLVPVCARRVAPEQP